MISINDPLTIEIATSSPLVPPGRNCELAQKFVLYLFNKINVKIIQNCAVVSVCITNLLGQPSWTFALLCRDINCQPSFCCIFQLSYQTVQDIKY